MNSSVKATCGSISVGRSGKFGGNFGDKERVDDPDGAIYAIGLGKDTFAGKETRREDFWRHIGLTHETIPFSGSVCKASNSPDQAPRVVAARIK
jgi:hypothetical protein